MIETVLGPIAGALSAVIVGLFVFHQTRKRDRVDDRSKLFDDALELAAAHKDAWEKATCEIEELRQEIAQLRDEIEDLRGSVKSAIREGEMWRGVAVQAYHAYERDTGKTPLWWPHGEPAPSRA